MFDDPLLVFLWSVLIIGGLRFFFGDSAQDRTAGDERKSGPGYYSDRMEAERHGATTYDDGHPYHGDGPGHYS